MLNTAPVVSARDLDLLASPLIVIVEEVQGDVVRLSVREVDVDREARVSVPGGGHAGRAAGRLQCSGVARVRRPGKVRLAGGRDRGVRGVVGRAADDVVALRAVGPDPVTRGRGVLIDEHGRRVGDHRHTGGPHDARRRGVGRGDRLCSQRRERGDKRERPLLLGGYDLIGRETRLAVAAGEIHRAGIAGGHVTVGVVGGDGERLRRAGDRSGRRSR